jgi:hypothetical protein
LKIYNQKPILFTTYEYCELEIEGTPYNQLPKIVDFQNTDGRKITMPDDIRVHEEKTPDSGKTYSDLLTSGKLSCSNLEPSSHIRRTTDVMEEEFLMGSGGMGEAESGGASLPLVGADAMKPASVPDASRHYHYQYLSATPEAAEVKFQSLSPNHFHVFAQSNPLSFDCPIPLSFLPQISVSNS